jgi:hypothetical protein
MRTEIIACRSRSALTLAIALCSAACAEMSPDASESRGYAVAAENGLSYNGMSFNGFSYNGMSFNGFSYNGMSFNGLSYNGMSFNGMSFNGLVLNGLEGPSGLSSTSGLMTTEGGRKFVEYLVKCAYPTGAKLIKSDQFGISYTFEGSLGIAPELQYSTCDVACQERISACLLAHVNNTGLHVGIWLVGPDDGIGWGSNPSYPYQEATYFGNLFTSNMPGNYCAGRDFGSGDAKGRLGSPFGNNGATLNPVYGVQYAMATQQNVAVYCGANCTTQNEGYSSCRDISGNGLHPQWAHPVTVYRNFEPTQLYRICNKSTGKCLGVVGGSSAPGANVEQRTFRAAAGQTWQILQISAGNYKIVNRTSGMVLDLNGTQVVQRAYTGADSQKVSLAYLTGQPGYANVRLGSSLDVLSPYFGSSADGALVNLSQNSTADSAAWSLIAISLGTVDPGAAYRLIPQHATMNSVDVANGSTTNGTMVQQYATWNGDSQKFFITDAGKGNVRLTMKTNANKCLGPVGNSTAPGTQIEVQDCSVGSYTQAWITAETTQGSGIFAFRNAATPAVCLDVTGMSSANGARIQLLTCNGANNQLFRAQAAP